MDEMIEKEALEAACKIFADASNYYIPFHRGLSSPSADRIRDGMRAVLVSLAQFNLPALQAENEQLKQDAQAWREKCEGLEAEARRLVADWKTRDYGPYGGCEDRAKEEAFEMAAEELEHALVSTPAGKD